MMAADELDQMFDRALKLEMRGDWQEATALYEHLSEQLQNQPNAVYALNCAAPARNAEAFKHQRANR